MKVLFLTNYPSPYRVDFFNLLGQHVDLTVLFTIEPSKQTERDKAWFNENYTLFHAEFLETTFKILNKRICADVIKFIKQGWDIIISGGYSDPTQMLAFEWMKRHRVPFYMELDGGLIKHDSPIKKAIKKRFISMPDGYFSSGKTTDDYLIYYGAGKDRIWHYPFTSLCQADIDQALFALAENKKHEIRETLGIRESKVILGVGQFIHRKGFDVLIRAAAMLPQDIGIYIVGGEPTEQYLHLKDELNAENVHFVGFKKKEELKQYYIAADVFVMPTREDIWGLVINEALSFGLPVISTDRCVAALELIQDSLNGIIIPADSVESLAGAMLQVIKMDLEKMGQNAINAVSQYSIENMVQAHIDALKILTGEKTDETKDRAL